MLLIVSSCLLVFGTLNTKVDTYCCFSSKLAYDTTYWLFFDTNNLLMHLNGLSIYNDMIIQIFNSLHYIALDIRLLNFM